MAYMDKRIVKGKGFTIVELLIVIVVIAVLAAITIVAYNGIQLRAHKTSVVSALSQSAKKIELYNAEKGDYPNTAALAGVSNTGNIAYQYAKTGTGYCLTATIDDKLPHNIAHDASPREGPCDGQSGGGNYCPDNGHVAINGYFCEGTEGSIATLHGSVTKLSASASEVPSGAPGAFVSRQTSRDNLGTNTFAVTTGQVYCIEGWAATNSSTVAHALGLQLSAPSTPSTWRVGGNAINPSSTWQKASGCITIPDGFTTARLWTQNDGTTGGGTASPAWYQTAIKLTKQ